MIIIKSYALKPEDAGFLFFHFLITIMLELKLTFHNLNAVAMVTLEIAILFLFCVKNILFLVVYFINALIIIIINKTILHATCFLC